VRENLLQKRISAQAGTAAMENRRPQIKAGAKRFEADMLAPPEWIGVPLSGPVANESSGFSYIHLPHFTLSPPANNRLGAALGRLAIEDEGRNRSQSGIVG
jgi:hypothetical protein